MMFRVAARLTGGAALGLFFGALAGGVFGVVVAGIAEATNDVFAGLNAIWIMIFIGAAGFAAPGGAIAGALCALSRRPFQGLVIAIGVSLIPAGYLCIRAWHENDPEFRALDLPFFLSPLIGPIDAWIAIPRLIPKNAPADG